MKRLKRNTLLLFIVLCWILNSCDNQPKDKYLSQRTLNKYAEKAQLIERNTVSNSPFDTLIYNKVVAYDFERLVESYGVVTEVDGRKKFASNIFCQKSLNQKQVDFLTNFLGSNDTYGGNWAACFEPHLGIVFYQDDEIKCVVNICLDCNQLISSVKIPAQTYHKIDEGTEYEEPLFGFSEQGKQNIIELCKEIGFDYGERQSMENKTHQFP